MKTTDIWFASYLQVKGYTLKDFEVIARGKGKYEFDISSVAWKKEKLLFANNDISKIKMNFTSLRDLLY